MTTSPILRSLALAGAGFAFLGAASAHAEIQKRHFEIVTGTHTNNFVTTLELPFFNEELPERSGGQITTNAVPYTELGLTGFEILELLELGTSDISFGVIGYISGSSPIVEGLELPGLTNDLATFRAALADYRPLLETQFEENHHAKLMVLYVQPKLQAYCKLSEAETEGFTLDTLRGKKIRVHSTAYANFVEGLGGIPVTMAFADIVPALERGVLDCAITAPNAAYGAKMQQITNAIVDLPAGYSTHFLAMNGDTWNSLNEETQAFMTEQFADLEARYKEFTVTATEEALACLTDGPCGIGAPGGMTLIGMDAAEEEALKPTVETYVLKRWAERCGEGCAAEWNELVGGTLGLTAAP
ncbi:TRAP transporter substrate-binding protein DctP [Poseidonocella sp. HB161398]|uniref:TRAP transporter substrate-binding protein DctP n=1 Tax=Poseidonocella sp. HB161398 TaxID=2320855 RepID=UPI001487081C|nr:TRAP transporter substrate-binding protein DctP [Poseidonocella sp. HB161398]